MVALAGTYVTELNATLSVKYTRCGEKQSNVNIKSSQPHMYANQNAEVAAEVHSLLIHFSEKKSLFQILLRRSKQNKKNRFAVNSISCFESINIVQNYYS